VPPARFDARVDVPAVDHCGTPPEDIVSTVPEAPAVKKVVAPTADWYGTAPVEPPDRLVAVEAVPVRSAVIVPAEKFPEAFLITKVEGVLVLAGVVQVGAPAPFDFRTSPVVPAAVNAYVVAPP
jgi:hypothetical protein